MTMTDILYIVFRHKWKMLVISMLGVIAALVLPRVRPVPYQSEARLYIRYVMDSKAPIAEGGNDSRIASPDRDGDKILNTELEILTTSDLAQEVADMVGPDKILGKTKGESNSVQAAYLIQTGLSAEPVKNSSVIRLLFRHSDSEVVQPVLARLIELYFKKHADMHAVGAFDEILIQETDQLHSKLAQTEDQLRNAKEKLGIISLDDTKKMFSEQIAKIQQQLLDADAELVGREAEVATMSKLLPGDFSGVTNMLSGSNSGKASGGPTTTAVAVAPPEKADEYNRICELLDSLRKKEQDLLLYLTPGTTLVKGLHEQVAANEKAKKELETKYPNLLVAKVSYTNSVVADPTTGRRMDIVSEMSSVSALQAKIRKLTEQLDQLRKEAAAVGKEEGNITELNREMQIQATQYYNYKKNLDLARMDEKLSASKVNISVIQSPSPPRRDNSKLQKQMATVALGGIAAAFALAFLIEFYVDQSLRRPADVELKLGLPLFLTIPRLSLNGHSRRLTGKTPLLLARDNHARSEDDGNQGANSSPKGPNGAPELELAPWDPKHTLRPFSETLRDRLITYFEIKNLTHKPKLVAVTSCAEGSGVSTIAAGLAASLSETGDGNVLLVDMNLSNGAARQFHKGDLACGLEDVLAMEKRENALVQDRLYVASEALESDQLPRAFPNRLKNLVPKLKASDYDYIIFDMPPVTQISVTPRLAKFMDMVLMVVESEKTDCQVVRHASSLLAESKANVGIVLNKRRSYVPHRVQQEL
jgi:uncharacterized protein involved in exopolysaccharide biosynthesis/Mrp family chromosome partitioning ATPase